ncbi:hypothetical protein [Azovibrio sp.]
MLPIASFRTFSTAKSTPGLGAPAAVAVERCLARLDDAIARRLR